ncbi:hypothetical protein CEQ51_15110 [Pseudomonas thivervalensis]|uniref:Uncharacterized protein n=1 Tax=Pseudomonas thivervalensis TaxID=86265 RepID=A0A2Z4ZVR8_9PSED|nr:hypothetical protein CE140_14555 [Pseudomonas thivervalensis]AXA61351.1 hypothetical protein CEQ51_15110 [Pseudomonas thivervalensis]
MVEPPGMWAGIPSLFRVGTVPGLMRILPMVWPEPAGCGVGTGFGRGWVSGLSIGRGLTSQQERPHTISGPTMSFLWRGDLSPLDCAVGAV